MGVSENREHPIEPNGFADHYPYEKWLFHEEYTLFSDKPIYWMYAFITNQTGGLCLGLPGFTWFPRPIVTAIRDLDCMAGEVNRT